MEENKIYAEQDYYEEFVKDYDEQISDNIKYNKMFLDAVWEVVKDGIPVAKLLNIFNIDEYNCTESAKETYERFVQFCKEEFGEQ
jgi:hypothetical protein